MFCLSFVSRLVTGVLTHHLGWVTGVALRQSDADQRYYHQTQVLANTVLPLDQDTILLLLKVPPYAKVYRH